MTTQKRLSDNTAVVLVTGLIIVLAVFVVAFFPYGRLRTTYDSYDLMDASKTFSTYLSAKNRDGHSYLVRAPLHPFLLSFFANKMVAMWWINVLSFLGSVFLIFQICRKNELSHRLTATACLIIIFSYPWLMNFQFFWTEGVFIVLILLLCLFHLKDENVFIIILICLLLFVTRKPGIFFFSASAVVYFLAKQWRNAVIVFSAGVATFVGWQWLEFSYGSTGYFGAMLITLDSYHRIFYLDAIASWFFPRVLPLWLRTIFLLSIFGVVVYFVRHQFVFQSHQRQHWVMVSLAGVYTLILISFSGVSGYEDAERYLNVVYPLWVVTAVSVFAKIVPNVSHGARNFTWAATGFWLSYIFLRTLHHLA